MLWRVEYFEDQENKRRTRICYVRASSQDDAAKIVADNMEPNEVSASVTLAVIGKGKAEPGPMLAPKV